MHGLNKAIFFLYVGLANALKSSGLFNLLDTFLGSLPSDQKDELYSYQMECMWRLGKWSTPYSPPSKVPNEF